MSHRYLPGQPHQLPRHNQPMACLLYTSDAADE